MKAHSHQAEFLAESGNFKLKVRACINSSELDQAKCSFKIMTAKDEDYQRVLHVLYHCLTIAALMSLDGTANTTKKRLYHNRIKEVKRWREPTRSAIAAL